MSQYKYISPTKKGYRQFKLTKKQHNELFKRRKKRWFNKFEYYYNSKAILIHEFNNWISILIETVLFPMQVLWDGLGSFKHTWRGIVRIYRQKETGYFTPTFVYSRSNKYDKIMKIIHKED